MKKFLFFLLFALIWKLFSFPILASERNLFGLHLTQVSDIHNAAKIINSADGDWGYVTIVIRLDILDHNTWQDFMDNCRKYHLIPIIRLGTLMQNDYWKRPSNEDINNLVTFLNDLNWPIKTRYIIPFNEINHDSEWGGEVDIKSFADTFVFTSQAFKSKNPDFFILSTPLDLAAPEKPPTHKSAANVYQEIFLYNPQYFNSFDGLASHSYPNHGYIGTPKDTGQHSIRGYQWELDYIRSLGINKDYPVFITETGWPHREGESTKNNYYTSKTSASFLLQAYSIWQSDPRIFAATPFIYNFPNTPFDHFSWIDKTETLYPAYQQVVDQPKSKNIPSQITSYKITQHPLPWLIFPDREYTGEITLQNTGQSIWGETKFCLNPETSANVQLNALCLGDETVLPGQSAKLAYKFKIAPTEKTESTYLGWENLGKFELGIITGNPVIYQPKENFFQRLIRTVNSFFIK